ncbi:gliding motility lipoprotein GldJ [Flavobacteriaceae bacterium]|jgi:gliding motility-associated lipoprotein GldJ|nr:gliding motility lipoprotein GldJ [Flavobacteriaceae bacterium]MCP4802388.1 gliding motility lipoprotein GldJ [Bacteroidota bacterium]MDB2471082.1 gliding motility lipoprotein GldJ [Flavobacteriaceae bacterium]MDB2613136.1 gliding motility lipoprotein GldJ [Flavobacteriaceae bacterium]MDC0957078.1 gliding motility lipoprotein GldJ [Flavobacteriaceae bacterium]
MDMKNTMTLRIITVFILSLSMFSCKKSSSSKNSSRATGWKINAKEGGFQYNTDFEEQATAPGLVFIEGGTFTMGRVQDDVMHDWNNSPNQQHVQSFYMDETEVTNMMYLEYLDWIKAVYPPSEPQYKAIYEGALPDTLVWRNRLGYSEVMVDNYLRHPAYAEYPVVGVSWIQAVEFASWRSDRVNELYLEDAGYIERDAKIAANSEANFSTDTYLIAPSMSYGGNDSITNPIKSRRRVTTTAAGDTINVYASRETGIISPKYRLPSEAEWEYAALGLSELRDYNVYRGRKKYPWDGQYTRSGNRKIRGDQLANFKQGKGDYGGIAGWSDDLADHTGQVKNYAPNDHGLYDMAGNVAEWVADVYRPIVDDEFNDFNYYRGNVYTKNAINDDGTVKIVLPNEVEFDTLSNGKLIARNLPGEIKKIAVDDNETYLRNNFDRSDNRNFRDGDKRSSRYFEDFNDDESEETSTRKMYNSPKHNVERDASGQLIKEYDKENNRTSMINDEVRVYKGGSWKDREYWLDPAQRRYYPQDMATDFIGFRCAMSRLGSKSKAKNKTKN